MYVSVSVTVCLALLCWHTQSRLIIKFIFKFLHQTLNLHFTFFRSNVDCQERGRGRESEKPNCTTSVIADAFEWFAIAVIVIAAANVAVVESPSLHIPTLYGIALTF